MKDYYCSQKFWFLSVYPEKNRISSCCSASPERVDTAWLSKNPGRLFNTPSLMEDRSSMLKGERVKSCESACWAAEDRNMISRRLAMQSDQRTHDSIESVPKMINIVLGSDCNMTCVYCCKQYSTAWYRDIKQNGVYLDDERFRINAVDISIDELGQNKIKQSGFFRTLLEECQTFQDAKSVMISGGEPFLYNGLPDLVNKFNSVDLYTGLGVDTKRFDTMLRQLDRKTRIVISGETMGPYYEFTRYGNTFDRFEKNLQSIKDLGFEYRFSITLSNLTIFGYKEFEMLLSQPGDMINFCTDPDYLGVNVLDDESKHFLSGIDYKYRSEEIRSAINAPYSLEQKEKFKKYIVQFTKRRNLSLEIYPPSFRKWIDHD